MLDLRWQPTYENGRISTLLADIRPDAGWDERETYIYDTASATQPDRIELEGLTGASNGSRGERRFRYDGDGRTLEDRFFYEEELDQLRTWEYDSVGNTTRYVEQRPNSVIPDREELYDYSCWAWSDDKDRWVYEEP